MHRSVRHLLCIAFVGTLAIACSKKKDEPVATTAPPSGSVQQPTVVTEPPAPPPPATVDVPPASSVAIEPKADPKVDPNLTPTPSTRPEVAEKKKPAKKAYSSPQRKIDSEDPSDTLSKEALRDGDLDEPAGKKPASPKGTKPKTASTATAAPNTTPAPPAASADDKNKDQRESQPSATALKRQVTVTTASHYACSTKDHKESVSVASETRGARITIGGQGPCPGEIKEWIAEVGDKRVDVHGTHGAQSKCTCAGTGDMVLRGLEPGTYDVHVNGGFNRPIAVKVVVGSP